MVSLPGALQTALQHHQAGRLQEAEALYRQILKIQPAHPDAIHLLGMIAYQVGQHQVAIDYISRAITLNPHVAEFQGSLGLAYRALGKLDEAVAHYRRALTLKPDFADAHSNLGNALRDQGKLEEAIVHYRQALAINPAYADAHSNLGNALRDQGNLEDEIAQYRRALALRPDFVEAHNNLGNALRDQGKHEEAITHFRRALALKPAYADAHNNLGNALKSQGKLEEAVAQYRQALALKPDYAEGHTNLGNALKEQGQVEAAVACFRRALALKPDYTEAENHLMHQLQHLCKWDQLEDLIKRQKQQLCTTSDARIPPFTFLCLPCSPAEQLRAAQNWAANYLASIVRLRKGLGFRFARTAKPKLRVGYLSPDFRNHPVGRLIPELFELHDRQAVEVHAYSDGPDDGSEIRKRLARACDRFVDVRGMSYVEAARRIYSDGIDLLVDLGGYTRGARTEILALRPAPLQVNWPYAGTMGAAFIDYIITDRFITPPGQEPFFSEKLVRLPDCYQINDCQRTVARRTPTRKECGLPENGFVFCSFNHTYKITPSVFDAWMRLLQKVQGSVLWLLETNAGVATNLRREAKARQVEPARLVFASRVPLEQHLARCRNADLFLDTLPYNAHATTSDALWAGLPVLTCVGETFASRVAGSILTAIGLPELITHSLKDYEALALRLARSPAKLAGLRNRLAKNRLTAPLFDSKRFTQHIERAYQMMWERYLRGEAPQHIEVPALPPMKKGSAKRRTTRNA
ncbi:MAG: tetratricopeptide repeat protein [Planctomycetota bacterium]